MAERQFTRKELGIRYGVARNTIYLWVQQGVLPDADVRHGSANLWSEARLADWERRHLRLLAGQGVDIDGLPQFVKAGRAPDQTKAKRTQGQPARRERDATIQMFATLAKVRSLLIQAMSRNRPLTRRGRDLAVSHLKESIAVLGK